MTNPVDLVVEEFSSFFQSFQSFAGAVSQNIPWPHHPVSVHTLHSVPEHLKGSAVGQFFKESEIRASICTMCWSQWPRGVRRRSSAARLLRFWVRIPPGAWMFVCCDCCMLSDRGFCDGLITRPEGSYRLWRVVVYDQETSKTRRLKPATGLWKYKHNWL